MKNLLIFISCYFLGKMLGDVYGAGYFSFIPVPLFQFLRVVILSTYTLFMFIYKMLVDFYEED